MARPHSRVDGERLRELRINAGLSLRELQAASGVDRGNLSRVEHGNLSMYPRNLKAVADVLGVRPTDLLIKETAVAA